MSDQEFPKGLRFCNKVDQIWVRFEGGLLIAILFVMICLTFSQVLMRNFFSTGVLWFDPVVRHLLLWVGFLGAAVATHEKRHINVDAISKLFRGKSLHMVNITIALVAFLTCIVLFHASYVFVKDTFQAGDRIHQVFPAWVAQMVLPYGFFVMSLRFLKDLMTQIIRFAKGMEPELGSEQKMIEESKNL